MKRKHLQPERGFTLIEVMIVAAIIAIIAAYAVPNYMESVRRANRADAKSQMTQLAAWMQQQYGPLGHQYPLNLNNAPVALQQSPAPPALAKFVIALGPAAAQAYTLTAAPQAPYVDPECGTLTLTSNGARAHTGPQTFDYCWTR